MHGTRLVRQLRPAVLTIESTLNSCDQRDYSRIIRSTKQHRRRIASRSRVSQSKGRKETMKGVERSHQRQRAIILAAILLPVLLAFGPAAGEIERRSSKQMVEESAEGLASGLSKDCGKSYSATCLKLDVVSFLDRLSEQEDISILPGVSVIKENGTANVPASEVVANLARDFPNDVEKRLDAYLVHKVGSYLNSHSISIKLFDPRTFEAARNFNEETLAQLGLGGGGQQNGVGTGKKFPLLPLPIYKKRTKKKKMRKRSSLMIV